MSALIEFRQVCKTYQMGDTTVRAADHISMRIEKGEFVAIVGQSGSGKSQTDWEHEYIIKYNVKDTSTDGTDHCNRRRPIVSGKCSKCII